jgi:predicted DNA-binding protein with PD1-like motif
MRSKLLNDKGERTYALVFETGDEPVSLLEKFAVDNKLTAGRFTAIGAFSEAVLGYFDWQSRKYEQIPVGEQVEVLSLVGDVALDGERPKIHAHVVLGKRDGSAHGGHLLQAKVRPTLELMLTESPAHLRKRHDPDSGLALIRID